MLAGEFNGVFTLFENIAGPGATPVFIDRGNGALDDIGANSAPSIADLDGDGDLDILAGRYSGDFVYFENTAGAGKMPAFARARTNVGAQTNPFGLADIGRRSAPSMADVDGDGDLDVLAGERSGDFFYFENTAGAGNTPVFAAALREPFGLVRIGGLSGVGIRRAGPPRSYGSRATHHGCDGLYHDDRATPDPYYAMVP